jgi:hypothetical protein
VISTATRVPNFEPLHPPRLQAFKRGQATIEVWIFSSETSIEF